MNKQQFLDAVRARLAGLPKADVERFLDYCREMIEGRMEDGLSEEAAVAAMGTPEYVASQFLMDTPPQNDFQSEAPKRNLQVWQVVLIALGCPVWLPLLFGLIVAAVSVVIGLAATVLGMYCAGGGIIAGGVALIIFGAMTVGMPELLFLLAAGFLLMGIGLLMILGCNFLAGCVIRLFRWLPGKVRSLFPRKEAAL